MIAKAEITTFDLRFFALLAGVDVAKVKNLRLRRIVPLAALLEDIAYIVDREGRPESACDAGVYAAPSAVAIRVAITAERSFGFDLATMIAAIETQAGEFIEAVRRAELGRNTWFGLSIDHTSREVQAASGRAEHVAIQMAGWQVATSARPSVVAMVHLSPIVREVVALMEAAGCYRRKIVPPDFILGDQAGRTAA